MNEFKRMRHRSLAENRSSDYVRRRSYALATTPQLTSQSNPTTGSMLIISFLTLMMITLLVMMANCLLVVIYIILELGFEELNVLRRLHAVIQ
ncbi:uncharacterized protein N7511_010465 [Penicillium nucicola]|uniref:uncharacterized protein n=1 Tax=Penicillium nucicola TaxID=1850975 RepID=UPI0025452A62|nr:uncharacterized protein N7511_010465 [Penicillium nucicola]KAJ5748769.1 hypothetical protein N7511_010465 [Penicillium nucicola]